jgi:hypothetical protein
VSALTAFGLVAVAAMLIFYAVEDRSPWCILAFAAACVLGSVYGFLQGARARAGRAPSTTVCRLRPYCPRQEDQHIFGGHDDHECPKDQRQHTKHRFRADQSTFATNGRRSTPRGGIKRGRANVGVGDAHASEHKRPEGA